MTDQETIPVGGSTADEPGRARWAAPALVAASVAGAGIALGALGGCIWWLWWGPGAKGQIFETTEGPTWYPNPWDPGQAQVFAATGEFALVGLGVGLLVGALAAVLARREAFAGFVGLLVGTGLGSAVAYLVGTLLSPPDPQSLVDTEPIGTTLPAAIDVDGWTAYVCWPLGGLLGFMIGIVVISWIEDMRRREGDASTWLSGDRSEQPPPP